MDLERCVFHTRTSRNASAEELLPLSALRTRAWSRIAGEQRPSQEFWSIPVDAIGPAFVLDRRLTATGGPIDPREVQALDIRSYRSSTTTTDANARWLAGLARSNKRGAWFNGIPHILTRGPVPLDAAVVVDWRSP